MFSAFQTFGKLGAIGKAIAAAWSPLALWPDGIATPGMWISPRTLTSEWQDYTGTTPVVTPGTVADSSNPVGLALDIRAGATVLTDPGNHMLQSTSVDRPLLSARVNIFDKTEDFANAAWLSVSLQPFGSGSISNAITAPDGTLTADFICEGAANNNHCIYRAITSDALTYTLSVFAKAGTRTWLQIRGAGTSGSEGKANFDLANGVVGNVGTSTSATITAFDNGWYLCRVTSAWLTQGSKLYYFLIATGNVSLTGDPTYIGDGTSGLYLWGAQLATAALSYQRVNTASDYDATGITPFQLYDGTDDGMATASFAAGTLTSAMDCMIAVRRDSAAACVAGLYNGIADATKFFGMAESGSGSGCVGSGAGTPTVWVDGVQLSGGTAVTRGTLHTALTVGDWHILEFRGLDLSTWTAAGFGLYTSYVFPGARGDILLYPSTASTEDKDAARQYLADYYGVTLP